MATPTVIPGIFLHESRLNLKSHLDLPHLSKLASPVTPTDMGVIDLWAFKRKAEVPLLAMNITSQNIQYIEGNSYTYDLATASDSSTYIVQDITTDAMPGIDGEEFPILVNNDKLGGYGSRLKFDLTSPIELEVVSRQIKPKGEHFIYYVKMVPSFNGEKFVPRSYLTYGSRIYKLAATRSREFGQNWDSWAISGSSTKKFVNFVSTAEFQSSYHITREAAVFSDGKRFDADWVKNMKDKVVEYVQLEGVAENGIRYLNDYVKNYPGQGQKIGFQALAMMYDDICVGILAKQTANYMMWGSGGQAGSDGLDSQILAPGLWFQLDYSGYKSFFNIAAFSIGILKNAVRDYFHGKVDILPGAEPQLTIRTGRGGFELISQLFLQQLKGVDMIQNAADFKVVEGEAGNLKVNQPLVRRFKINLIADFEVVLDPSLDPIEANELINPYVNGYRLSSYSMIIHDYNEYGGSDNIKILRPGDYGAGKIKMHIQNGTWMHPLTELNYKGMSAHVSTNDLTGFSAKFTSVPDTVWVKDPTRLLKLVPKNPLTGGSL